MAESLKEIKNKIKDDWISSFPQLVAFSQSKFYKVAGPVILGFELIKLPGLDAYRPHFVLYSLWKEDVKKCLDAPYILMEVYNTKGLQYNIPYLQHGIYFNEVVVSVVKQVPLIANDNVRLVDLFKLINSRFHDVLVKSNPYHLARLYELKLYSALYAGDKNKNHMQEIINEVKRESKGWNSVVFESWFGKVENWLSSLEQTVENKNAFLSRITSNKQDRQLSIFKSSELVL